MISWIERVALIGDYLLPLFPTIVVLFSPILIALQLLLLLRILASFILRLSDGLGQVLLDCGELTQRLKNHLQLSRPFLFELVQLFTYLLRYFNKESLISLGILMRYFFTMCVGLNERLNSL
jgi:hypothetical protein